MRNYLHIDKSTGKQKIMIHDYTIKINNGHIEDGTATSTDRNHTHTLEHGNNICMPKIRTRISFYSIEYFFLICIAKIGAVDTAKPCSN